MTKIAYLTGYTGKPTRTPEQLLQLAINLNAVVVDSRYSPYSRVPHWNGHALMAMLGSNRYVWLRQFGNRTYKQGFITLDRPSRGLESLKNHTADKFIILCACADGESCHRKQVGEYLAAHGWTVREVTQAEWATARLQQGIELMPPDQLAQWEGVRTVIESAPACCADDCAECGQPSPGGLFYFTNAPWGERQLCGNCVEKYI